MTPLEIVTVASDTAQALSQSASGRIFTKSIKKILDALSCVPDYAHAAFSSEQIAQLQLNGEQTIAAIELRIETGDDNGTAQLEMARAIYELRRELEDIDRWRRHYLGGKS
jgi:hypothetical protein